MKGGRQGAETPYRGVTSIRGRFAIGGLGGGGGHGSFGGDVGHFLSLSQRKGELLTFLAVFSYQKVQKKKRVSNITMIIEICAATETEVLKLARLLKTFKISENNQNNV